MFIRFCRWLAIRLIMITQHRTPDYIHGAGFVAGALPYYREWRLVEVLGGRLSLAHLTSSTYQPLTGWKLVLMGWYRGCVSDSPRRVVLRDEGQFVRSTERFELAERQSCWVLRLSRR